MNEHDEQAGRWLPLADAAPLLGFTVDALRKQIRRGRREGRRDNHGQWLVCVQPDRDGPERTARLPVQVRPAEMRAEPDGVRAELDSARTELAVAVARLDERDRRLAHLEGEVTWLRAELERRRWPGLKVWWQRFWAGEARR